MKIERYFQLSTSRSETILHLAAMRNDVELAQKIA